MFDCPTFSPASSDVPNSSMYPSSIEADHDAGIAPAGQNPPYCTNDSASLDVNPLDASSSMVSFTSAFLLGIHNGLEDVDLPAFVKEHQATLTFPEKLMLLLTYVDKEYKTKGANNDNTSISWILDGRAFVIRSREDLVKHLLPMFFRQAKFPSFTRKLYRWGFRQVSVNQEERLSSKRREMIFGHEFFQRDDKSLLSRMRSVTAAGTRRAVTSVAVKGQRGTAYTNESFPIQPRKMQSVERRVQGPFPQATHPPKCTTRDGRSTLPLNTDAPGYEANASDSCNKLVCQGGSPSLTEALSWSHQKTGLGTAFSNNLTFTLDRQENEQNKRMVDVSSTEMALKSMSDYCVSPHLDSMETCSIPQKDVKKPETVVEERIRDRQGVEPSASADPNEYMRAAVDLLLHYASSSP